MEKQFNSDTEQTNEKETLTYTVGQSPLPETPFLNVIYTDQYDGSRLFLLREDDEYYLIPDIKSPVTISRLKKFEEVFIAVTLGLIERGVTHVNVWVNANEVKDYNLALFFGFEETG